MPLFNKLCKWFIGYPIIVLMMLALSPLILASVLYDVIVTAGMSPDERARYYRRLP